MPDLWTVRDVLAWTAPRLAAAGAATPRLDAEVLLAHALGCERIALYLDFDRILGRDEREAMREAVRRRLAGEPVAYVVGRREFWSLPLAVDRRVLVPRPETETLVEAALDLVAAGGAARLADVGTGSGAVALALARERPAAQVAGTDASEDALAVARANGERLGLAVEWRAGDLCAPLAAGAPWDLVASNPPYVPAGEIARLGPEIAHEPRAALDGGADGLDVVRRLVVEALEVTAPGGWLVVEVGAGQASAAGDLLAAAGWREVRQRRDLAGLERVVAGRRA